MEEAKEFEIPQLKAFAAKLFQDIEAVVWVMAMPYSPRDRPRVGSTSSSSSSARWPWREHVAASLGHRTHGRIDKRDEGVVAGVPAKQKKGGILVS